MYYLCLENGRDGFGFQFYNQIYGILLAKKYKIHFYYEPMSRIGHNYKQDDNYEKELNDFTNLAEIYSQVSIDKKIDITDLNDIDKYLLKQTDKNILLKLKKKSIDLYKHQRLLNKKRKLIQKISDNFLKNKKNPYNNNKINIAIHIRSGDALFNIKFNQKRITNEKDYKILIDYLQKKFNDNYLIHLFFESKTTLGYGETKIHKVDEKVFNIKNLLGKNVILHQDDDLRKDFLHFVFADYLFVAKSSFSVIASIFNKNKVYGFSDFSKCDWAEFKDIKIFDINNISIE